MNLEEFKEIIYNDLGFCGCGTPEQAIRVIYEIMKNQQDDNYICKEHKEKFFKIITENLEEIAEILLYILNDAGLLEHGSYVGHSWLTSKGKEFINFYKDIEDKEDFL